MVKVLWIGERSETYSQLEDRGKTDKKLTSIVFYISKYKKVMHFLGEVKENIKMYEGRDLLPGCMLQAFITG